MTPVSVVVLTFNSQSTIGATLDSLAGLTNDVHVVDSGSTDATHDIVAASGAQLVHHPFENYGSQRNWAIDNLPLRHEWQLHLDADERLTPELKAEIAALLAGPVAAEIDGFYVPRLVHFHGRALRHGGMYPIYHMRLFRSGKGRCETRKYDQHFHVPGGTRNLAHPMIDDIRLSVIAWFSLHNYTYFWYRPGGRAPQTPATVGERPPSRAGPHCASPDFAGFRPQTRLRPPQTTPDSPRHTGAAHAARAQWPPPRATGRRPAPTTPPAHRPPTPPATAPPPAAHGAHRRGSAVPDTPPAAPAIRVAAGPGCVPCRHPPR